NVLFMVWSSGGRYRAVNLFPGRYEVTVRTAGWTVDKQTIALEPGEAKTLDLALREEAGRPVRQGEFGFTSGASTDARLVSYDELYPLDPAPELLETQGMYCHGRNSSPSNHYPKATWTPSTAVSLARAAAADR